MDFLFAVLKLIKPILIVFSIILFGGTVYAAAKGWKYRPHLATHSSRRKGVLTVRKSQFREQWEEILKKLASGSHDSLKVAIVEADRLVDTILKDAGLEGGHMADRLDKLKPDELVSFNRLWRAHRVRNEVVHSPDFEITAALAEQTIEDYGAVVKETHVID